MVLTASDPEALLPTILSRVVRVRVARLVDSVVTDFAQRMLGMTGKAELAQRVSAAEGALAGSLPQIAMGARESARRRVARGRPQAGGAATLYALALTQMPFQARAALPRCWRRWRAGCAPRPGLRRDEELIEAIARVMDARELAQGT